jgi:hypothetical protein
MESEFHPPFNWRDHLPVHPAADLFPLLAETDPKALQVLAEDIRKNGLHAPIILASIALCNDAGMTTGKYNKPMLLDGRNRLDALALLGWLEVAEKPKRRPDHRLHDHIPVKVKDDIDWEVEFKFVSTTETASEVLYETAISLNLHRRHLTAEQKRELIAKVLKQQPQTSDRQIGDMVKADNKTVAKVRADLERREDIPHVETRTDSKGRKQSTRKPKRDKQPSTPPPRDDAEASAKARKAHYAAEERPVPERTAEPQASDAHAASANKRIWKSKVTKVELLTMLEPIQALAFKDDEGQDFVASISDGDAALYDTLESAKGVIDNLQTVLRLHQIDGSRKADAANHAEAAPLIPDDLSIPEFLRREKDDVAGKAAA